MPGERVRHFPIAPDGRVDVEVHQLIRDVASGALIADQVVHHVYELHEGKIAAMHVRT